MKPALRPAVDAAARRLAAAGVPSPRHDAEVLAAHVLAVERRDLWRQHDVGDGFQRAFEELVGRRERREPLQHLTGVAYFRHAMLAVGPGVFVPRPETELVAGAAIDEARRVVRTTKARPVVVDLGTGSGAIARSVADEEPAAVVHAVELADAAIPWARANIAGSAVVLHHDDMAMALTELDGMVDVVVSNPPYIPTDGLPRDPEVRDHDPSRALYGGSDGLVVIRVVERVAARLLRHGGLVIVEHADTQGASAPGVFVDAPGAIWTDVTDTEDLAGRPRFVTARRL